MNSLGVTVLLHVPNDELRLSIMTLMTPEGRPLFDDEVKPQWKDVYESVRYLFPPDTLEEVGSYIRLSWYETNYTLEGVLPSLKKTGATVRFMHAVGDALSADPGSGQDSYDGYFYLNDEAGEVKSLTSDNVANLLPDCKIKWNKHDPDSTLDQLLAYLTSH